MYFPGLLDPIAARISPAGSTILALSPPTPGLDTPGDFPSSPEAVEGSDLQYPMANCFCMKPGDREGNGKKEGFRGALERGIAEGGG